LIDTHCHLYLNQFDNDLDEVIHTAISNGIHHILVPGIDSATSMKSITLSSKYSEKIFSAIGIHPNYSEKSDTDLIKNLLLSYQDRIYAIGEIGLDFYRDFSPRGTQVKVFNKMLSYAKEFNLPICIHNRNADTELLKILDNWYGEMITRHAVVRNGVFHSFNGSDMIAKWGIAHNFAFGISGPITYKKSNHLRKVVRRIGINHLVLETDAPFSAPAPHRGKRNSPLYLSFIAQSLAEILDITINEVIDKTDQNARNLFNFN